MKLKQLIPAISLAILSIGSVAAEDNSNFAFDVLVIDASHQIE